jgi:predicted enzyme related to lactoylglutathione lyase
MITSAHAIVYAEDAEATRAFFRDVLELPFVDSGGGWLIFKLPPAELGVHPAGEEPPTRRHELFLMCDDIEATIEELTAKGVEFTGPVENAGFGRITSIRVPGGGELGLYEPRHAVAHDLES